MVVFVFQHDEKSLKGYLGMRTATKTAALVICVLLETSSSTDFNYVTDGDIVCHARSGTSWLPDWRFRQYNCRKLLDETDLPELRVLRLER